MLQSADIKYLKLNRLRKAVAVGRVAFYRDAGEVSMDRRSN